MVAAIKHFKYYLCGRPFPVRTDHSALQWLMSLREPEGYVAWSPPVSLPETSWRKRA